MLTPELAVSLNTSLIYTKAWFKSAILHHQQDCLALIACQADQEVQENIKSPVAHVLSEVLNFRLCQQFAINWPPKCSDLFCPQMNSTLILEKLWNLPSSLINFMIPEDWFQCSGNK